MAYNNRADTYIAMGQPERALADLDQALKFDPGFGVAYANRAFAYTILGRNDEACRDLALAARLGLDPDILKQAVRELRSKPRE